MSIFHSSEEQALLRQAVDGFLRDRAAAGERGWSKEGWQRLPDELGILALPFPEDVGGLGGSLMDAVIVMERLGEHLVVQPYLQTVIMAGRAIVSGGGDDRAERLATIGSGAMTVAIAHVEASSRNCVRDVGLRATPEGGGFVLDGNKIVVLAADWSTHLLVSARSGGGQRDANGISLFLIEKDRPGVSLRLARTIDGWCCADIAFDRVRVGAADLVGAAGGALQILETMMEEATVALCAEGVGLMRSMIEQTVAYGVQRKQFGKTLASFQVIQHRLVDMRLLLEHATSLADAAASAVDGRSQERALLVSAAKYLVNRALNFVGRAAVQTHGAIGMMEETTIAQYFKRSTVLQLQCGSAADHLGAFAEQAGATVPTAMRLSSPTTSWRASRARLRPAKRTAWPFAGMCAAFSARR